MEGKGRLARTAALVARSWLRNADAEACGSGLGWAAAALCLVLAASMVAFPLSLSRYREARSLAEPARWPGIGAALLEVAAKGGDFRIEGGKFLRDQSAPTELSVQGWKIILDAGEVWNSVPAGKVLRFGRERVTASDDGSKSLIDAPESVFEGVTGAELRALSRSRPDFTVFVKGFLSVAASAGAPGAIIAASLLMLVQAGLFVLVIGFLLSLSGLRIAGQAASARRGAGFASSLRSVAALSIGAAIPAAALGLLFPRIGSLFGWLVFALALGIRTIVLYAGRFRAKTSG